MIDVFVKSGARFLWLVVPGCVTAAVLEILPHLANWFIVATHPARGLFRVTGCWRSNDALGDCFLPRLVVMKCLEHLNPAQAACCQQSLRARLAVLPPLH
jgi:hypothetical protein